VEEGNTAERGISIPQKKVGNVRREGLAVSLHRKGETKTGGGPEDQKQGQPHRTGTGRGCRKAYRGRQTRWRGEGKERERSRQQTEDNRSRVGGKLKGLWGEGGLKHQVKGPEGGGLPRQRKAGKRGARGRMYQAGPEPPPTTLRRW